MELQVAHPGICVLVSADKYLYCSSISQPYLLHVMVQRHRQCPCTYPADRCSMFYITADRLLPSISDAV
jgi:hypothetical protein